MIAPDCRAALRLARARIASLAARALVMLLLVAAQVATAPVASAQVLQNAHLRVTFGARGMTSIADLAAARTDQLGGDDAAIVIGTDTVDTRALAAPVRDISPGLITYRYRTGTVMFDVSYELKPRWKFVAKRLAVTALAARKFTVNDVTLFRATLSSAPVSVVRPKSAQPRLGTFDYGAALRIDSRHSLLLVAQNPFLHATVDGNVVTLRYAPEMEWSGGDGAFVSDRALLAPVQLSGRVLPESMTPEWRTVERGTPGLDQSEVDAFTGMVRSMFIYEPTAPLNVFVGWCVNDYQIDVGTAEGRAEYRRIFDQAAAVGAQFVLYAPSNSAVSRREESVDDWSWEHVLWLGLGQKIRRNEWNPRTSAIPPSVAEMLDAARDRKLKLLAYVYPVLPFSQNPAWLVPSRRDSTRKAASLGNRALQDWLIEELIAFREKTGVAGFAFDHTFLDYSGTSRYAQWWGWRRVMEELRRRVPDIVIDGRQAYHLYGPWSYLAGSYPHPTFHDEQPESFTPFPDLRFDRVSANRERYTAYRYRNYEFTPSELVPGFMTHQTPRLDETEDMPFVKTADRGTVLSRFRVRDWDYLGWRYSVLSSIAVAGWNNVLNMLPARDSAENAHFADSDRVWLRDWLQWTNTNKELLRHTLAILGQPAVGKIDGTAAIDRDHGFIFLFNPDPRRLSARVALDGNIGLTAGRRFIVREVFPQAGRRIGKPSTGVWRRGDTLELSLVGGSAMVLELKPALTSLVNPLLFGATGSARVAGRTLILDSVVGEAGTRARLLVQLPRQNFITRATINGAPVTMTPARGRDVQLDVTFAGAAFAQLQPVIAWDSTFTGGTIAGTLTIPQRIFDQLRSRRHAWPIPWTTADYRTTWLVPERLLLWAPLNTTNDSIAATLRLDDAPVTMQRAYTAVRAARGTFTGFYADISALQPDRPYRVALTLPTLSRGQFLGLYVENVEPEYTRATSSSPR